MIQQIEGQPGILVPIDNKTVFRVVALGAAAGAIVWGLTILLDNLVFKNALCQGNATMQCEPSIAYASAVASILAAGIVLFGLIRYQVYRALLIVIACTISLWGIELLLTDVSWILALLVSVFLYAVTYLLTIWTARIRLFLVALLLIIIEVAVIRLTLGA